MRIGSKLRLALALALGAVSGGVAAADLALEMPVACRPGTDCWIVNYVDLDPGPGVRDFQCGQASYNGHKGVDFAVRDLSQVRAGVPVRAAAPGEVLRVRDGVEDLVAAQGGQECGNGVVLDHGQGWTTQYCHLRRGSIAAKPGQRVAAGDIVGMVGQSGLADFPHVHLQVARNGTIIDPFLGADGTPAACGLGKNHLWSKAALERLMPYRPTAVFNGGIAPEEPKPAKARAGGYDGKMLAGSTAALVGWADVFWVQSGDRVRVRLVAPSGATLAEKTTAVEKTQARRFVYAGARRPGPAWPPGVYGVEVVVLRDKDGRVTEESRLADRVTVR